MVLNHQPVLIRFRLDRWYWIRAVFLLPRRRTCLILQRHRHDLAHRSGIQAGQHLDCVKWSNRKWILTSRDDIQIHFIRHFFKGHCDTGMVSYTWTLQTPCFCAREVPNIQCLNVMVCHGMSWYSMAGSFRTESGTESIILRRQGRIDVCSWHCEGNYNQLYKLLATVEFIGALSSKEPIAGLCNI